MVLSLSKLVAVLVKKALDSPKSVEIACKKKRSHPSPIPLINHPLIGIGLSPW